MKRAMLVEIDPATKTSRSAIEYESPKEVTADQLPATSLSTQPRVATSSIPARARR